MRQIIWSAVGAVFGWRALCLASRDIAKLRHQGTTFGQGHLTDRFGAPVVALIVGSASWWALSNRLTNEATLVVYGLWCAGLMRLFFIDVDTHVLPRRTVVGATIWGIVGLCVVSLFNSNGSVVEMMLAASIMWGVLKFLEIISRGDLGAGDVSMAPLLGLFTGWLALEKVFTALVLAFFIGGVYATILMVSKRASRRTFIAFGPFLIAGAFISVLR